jgi:aspartate/methionine/tyrosine aminotransferase
MLINRPEGAFYILADIAASATPSDEFARRLVTSQGVAVAPGLTFGPLGNDVVRISLAAAEDQLRVGIDRLVQAVRDVRDPATLGRVSQ